MKYIKPFCTEDCVKQLTEGKLQCNCGEDVGLFNWHWKKVSDCSNVNLTNYNKDILFHPIYSTGTMVVKGDIIFKPNRIYYWEVKILSDLRQGTSVMVGVGTKHTTFSDWKFRFGSPLGVNSESWGYCHRGFIQHNNITKNYGTEFGIGNLVGIFLDMYYGTLEYYINRHPQGVAFTGLKSYELVPLMTSTTANTAIRTTCTVSDEDTLQMRCLQIVSEHPLLYKYYQEIPGLAKLCQRRYFWVVPPQDSQKSQCQTESEDERFSTAKKVNHWRNVAV